MNSAIYEGTIRHTRIRPVSHSFSYSAFYLLFDLDELEKIDTGLSLFSVGRRNLFSLRPSDHGPLDGSDLRTWADRVFAEAGVNTTGGSVKLLAFPRMLGYAFNPLSVWYATDRSGELIGVIHEVRNTFGDRHLYVSPVGANGLQHSFSKQMHVSPFNDLQQRYEFGINAPGARLRLSIDQSDEDGVFFRAGMRLNRVELSDRNLAHQFFSHPLLTMKVVLGIHYQALKLWLKGAVFHHRPEPSRDSITLARQPQRANELT